MKFFILLIVTLFIVIVKAQEVEYDVRAEYCPDDIVQITEQCGNHRCWKNGTFDSATGCGLWKCPRGQLQAKLRDQDITKPYPECCPEYECFIKASKCKHIDTE